MKAPEPPEPPPSTLKWPATPRLRTQVEVGPSARELGRLQQMESLPEALRECAEENLKDLPGLKGYLGTVAKGQEIMRSRDLTREKRAAKEKQRAETGTHFYPWVSEATGKFNLDVHQAEFFVGSQGHRDLIRIPIQEGLPRTADTLVKAGKRSSAGVDIPRLACFTQPAGSDKVYFRVGKEAVGADYTVPAGSPGHGRTTIALGREPHDKNREWRAFPIGNGHHLIPSVGNSDGEVACELMMRMSRGDRLDKMVGPGNRSSRGHQGKSIAERWQARTGGKEQVVRIPKDWKKPLPFDAMVRELRQGLHDHGSALLTATTGMDTRRFVLMDIQMHDAKQGVAIVADPDTATVTEVPFGPDQQFLVPPDCRDRESRLTATFFTRDPKYSAPLQAEVGGVLRSR